LKRGEFAGRRLNREKRPNPKILNLKRLAMRKLKRGPKTGILKRVKYEAREKESKSRWKEED